MIICEDQEQVDKILEMKDKLPLVEMVIYDDPKGMRHYDYPFLLSLDRVQEMGTTFAAGPSRILGCRGGEGQGRATSPSSTTRREPPASPRA
jgi:long-chain acyl-CoA synthetase